MTRLDPVDVALAAALGLAVDRDDAPTDDDLLDVDELAEAADTPVAVIEAIHREGLLVARTTDPLRFAATDADTIRAAMAMLLTGLPLAEFLDLARRADEALRDLAEQAVQTFLLYVRDPVRGAAQDGDRAGAELVDKFEQMLPAVRGLVGGHFEALVLGAARDRLRDAVAAAADPADRVADPVADPSADDRSAANPA